MAWLSIHDLDSYVIIFCSKETNECLVQLLQSQLWQMNQGVGKGRKSLLISLRKLVLPLAPV